jgi:hypothetical protein
MNLAYKVHRLLNCPSGVAVVSEPDKRESEDPVKRIALLAWLETLKRDFDPVLLEARKQYHTVGWVGALTVRSLLGIHYAPMPKDSVQKFVGLFSNRIVLWILIGATGGSGIVQWIQGFKQWPLWINIVLLVIALLLSIRANLTRMLTLGDSYFNPNAYKLFRPTEYFMILSYLKETNYTFATASDWLKLMYQENSIKDVVSVHRAINEKLTADALEFKEQLVQSEQRLKDADESIKLLNQKIVQLFNQAKVNEEGYNSAIDVLYRLRSVQSLFNRNDLRLISAFSLFEVVEDHLYRICEQGTTETPETININDPQYEDYSSVKLVNSEKTIEYATSAREGRTVASYWIDLPSERALIYNFHYDSTNESIRDIIESKEMYRFVRGICLHLEERGLLERGGARHGGTQGTVS